jgi:CubicO group peptidase (beta-lactamase class C family)
MMRRLPFLLASAVLAALPAAFSARADTVAGIEQAWRDWAARHERVAGGIVVLHKGKVVHQAATGRLTPATAVPLASLSKAVTAVCIAGLVDRGRLGLEMPLSQALARTFARLGAPADERLLGVTIAQLLTHRAGYTRSSDDPDPTTGPLGKYLGSATAKEPAFDAQLRLLLPRRLALGPGERYAYTNSVYLLLGVAIEEATGEPYESYCRQAVLAPLGASASAELTPEWRILASYGGWSMTLADYGRFYQAFARDNPAIGPASRRWMMSPSGKQVAEGVHYGFGTDVRPIGNDANFWHGGRWTFSLGNAYDGPLRASHATWAVRYGNRDVNIVVYTEPATAGPMRGELDRALSAAVAAVKSWP